MHNSQNLNKMKLITNTITQVKKIFLVVLFSGLSVVALSQSAPPDPGGNGGNQNNTEGNQLGGAAHVGGGVLILLSLALAYGGKRFYELRKQEKLQF